MIIKNIKIKNFRSLYGEHTFNFENLNGLVKLSGIIGSGKTSLGEAIIYGLFGKVKEHKNPDLVAQPIVKLPTAERIGLTPDKEELLSKIIAEINSRTGKTYDNDVAVKAMLQIRDIMMKSEKLRKSAKSNTLRDFEFEYYDGIDDALIKGLSENKDFFSLLLNNEDIKKDVLGIFSEEIYNSLRKTKK